MVYIKRIRKRTRSIGQVIFLLPLNLTEMILFLLLINIKNFYSLSIDILFFFLVKNSYTKYFALW